MDNLPSLLLRHLQLDLEDKLKLRNYAVISSATTNSLLITRRSANPSWMFLHNKFGNLISSIIDLQNTQTECARNIEDVYRKLISLSSQLHGRSPPETQTIPPPNTGGVMQALLGEDQIQTSPCPESQQRTSADLRDPIGHNLGNLQQDGADQANTPKSGPPPNPYGASVQRTQMDNAEFGPSPAPRALADIFDLSTQPY